MNPTTPSTDLPPTDADHNELKARVAAEIAAARGWLPFDRYMQLALYAPGLGYYTRGNRQLGMWPGSGSDFVTAPELSPLYGRALAQQVAEGLRATGSQTIWEFGAGSGALAKQIMAELDTLNQPVQHYHIVDVSGSLRALQQTQLANLAPRVQWLDALPDAIEGVVIGNEVLDAMPVKLLARHQGQWHERGVTLAGDAFVWQDRPTTLRPPLEVEGDGCYVTETHSQAEAFIATLAEKMQRGQKAMAWFIDYGFPEAEYYHWQRDGGTVMCHQAHHSDTDPLADVGAKDITAHVNFTGIALAAQNAGLEVLGYTSQGRFLINCGLAERMEQADLPARIQAMPLINEHEMGELFKVIGLATPEVACSVRGFATGDRTHRL